MGLINIILFGKPGAGKGTQASFLKDKYDFVHLSTGDLFRLNINNKTNLGLLVKQYINRGELVPDQVTIDMLHNEMSKYKDVKGFLFDGFPRTIAQAKALDDLLGKLGQKINATIALEASDEELTKRIIQRGFDSGRVDDQDLDKIKNRFVEYSQKTESLISFYKNQKKFYSVNGIGEISTITHDLCAVIDNL